MEADKRLPSKEFYSCSIKIYDRLMHWIWFTNDKDGFLFQSSGSPLYFDDLDQLSKWMSSEGGSVKIQSSEIFDWDRIRLWASKPNEQAVRDGSVLETWNLCKDFAETDPIRWAKFSARSQSSRRLYDEVFRLTAPPVMEIPAEIVSKSMRRGDLEAVAQLINVGLHTYLSYFH